MSLYCEFCKKELPYALVDGYNFGDRLLEGVMFKVEHRNEGPNCIGVEESSEAYMKGLNWEHWKKKCEEYCEDLDIAQCPDCHDDIDFIIYSPDDKKPKPVFVGKSISAQDLFSQIAEQTKDINIVPHLISKLSENYKARFKNIIDILDKSDRVILTIFPDDQYIQFHDEFTQIGIELPQIKEILKMIEERGWTHNHD